MKKLAIVLFLATSALCLSGCISTPYAHVGASKTVNIGGINVGAGIGDVINLGK